MSCEGRRDAMLLFAAGVLEEAEAAPLRAHLEAGCAECARHLDEARQLESALAFAAEDAQPAATRDLRGELLRRANRVPHQSAAPPRARRAPRRFLPLALAAGLGALLAAPLGFWLAAERHGAILGERTAAFDADLADVRSELDEQEEELAELEAHARILESDLERAHRQVAMLSEFGLVTLDLRPAIGIAHEAHARVFWNWDDYYCYLHAEGLGSADAPAVYALWLDTEKGDRVLAGTFRAEEGAGTLWVQLPRDMDRAVRAEITLEPESPGPSPHGAVQLSSGPPRAL
jgi:Anti-sigma-K factor rskA, C-terminal